MVVFILSSCYKSIRDFTISLCVLFDPGPMQDRKILYCSGASQPREPGVMIFRPENGTSCLDILFTDGSGHRIFCWFQMDGINDERPHDVKFVFVRVGMVSAFVDGKKHSRVYDISSQRGPIPLIRVEEL